MLPLARDLELTVDTSCERNDVDCVANKVRKYEGHGNILIAWRHGSMGDILETLGVDDPPEYPPDR